jgi:hypothetical protein
LELHTQKDQEGIFFLYQVVPHEGTIEISGD